MIQRWRTLPPYWRRVTLRLALLPLFLFLLYSTIFLLLDVIHEPPWLDVIDEATPEQRAFLEDEYGIGDSTWQKYRDFWHDAITLDFGHSLVNRREIRENLRVRWMGSAQLLAMSAVAGAAIAVATGAWTRSAGRARTLSRGLAALIAGIPLVFVIIQLLIRPQEWWGYAPPIGLRVDFTEHPWDNLRQFLPAAAAMGILAGVWSSRVVRAALQPVDGPVRPVHLAHASAAALGDMTPILITGLIVVEPILTIPGLGEFFLKSATVRDLNGVQAGCLLAGSVALVVWCFAPALPRSPDASSAPAALLRKARSNPLLIVGLVIVAIYVFVGVAGPWLAPYAYRELPGFPNENPSRALWFGTDKSGHDLFSLTLLSTRTSIQLSALVVAFGVLPGAVAGFGMTAVAQPDRWRWTQRLMGIVRDTASAMLSLPALPAVLLFIVVLDLQVSSIVAALAAFAFALTTRGLIDADGDRRRQLYALAGATTITAASCIALQTLLGFEAGPLLSSFYPDEPTWGQMLNSSRASYPYHTPAAIFPALAITIFTAGFLLIRTALDDLDPPRPYER